jgi:valyl-tRNA synthetase
MSEDRVEHGRNFMNKIWNSARFVLNEIGQADPNNVNPERAQRVERVALAEMEGFTPAAEPPKDCSLADRWILSRLQAVITETTASLENYRFNEYAGNLESFFWNEFCDDYIELAKPELKDPARQDSARWTLWKVLDTAMRLLHPVVPFITEEIWQRLPRAKGDGKLLMLDKWPSPDPALRDPGTDGVMAVATGMITAIRTLKHENGVDARHTAVVYAQPMDAAARKSLEELSKLGYIESLAHATIRTLGDGEAAPKPHVSTVIPGFSVFLAIEVADTAAETARLSKECEELKVLLIRTRATLSNEGYVKKAPPAVVEETRKKAADFEARISRLTERLNQLKG